MIGVRTFFDSRRLAGRAVLLVLLGVTLPWQASCVVGALVGGMAESARRTGKTTISAEYTGLQDKSFAVVCVADRAVQAEEPGLVARIVTRVNERLALNAGASHFIRSDDLLATLYNAPQWSAMSPGDVAEMLGVERLVWIEVLEYRLHEPGNRHVWDGVLLASVRVYESDSGLPNDPMFERQILVRFPDSSGYLEEEIPAAAVSTELSNRLVNRAAWLFYEHDEPNTIPY